MTTPTLAISAPFPVSGEYVLDPNHTRISFVARHAMVTRVRGYFHEFSGVAHIDAQDPSRSHAQVTIKAASVDTGNEQRDAHLRSNDFFDMTAFPEITFTSTAVGRVDGTHFTLTGDLTIKGTTRPVTLDLEFTGASVDPYGGQRLGFEGSVVVNRKDWGVSWNAVLEGGGALVSNKVTLELAPVTVWRS